MSTENTSFRFTAEEETPVHGHTELTEEQVEAVNEQLRDIADVPAIEIISSAAIHMMSAAAVKCGLAAEENADDLKDLDEARKLITALAGLVTAAAPTSTPSSDGKKRCFQISTATRPSTAITPTIVGKESSAVRVGPR